MNAVLIQFDLVEIKKIVLLTYPSRRYAESTRDEKPSNGYFNYSFISRIKFGR